MMWFVFEEVVRKGSALCVSVLGGGERIERCIPSCGGVNKLDIHMSRQLFRPFVILHHSFPSWPK